MKQEIAEKWANALLSKAYKQGRYQLRNSNDEFCCLGVLCDLYAKENTTPVIPLADFDRYLYFGDDVYLPEQIKSWAGLLSAFGRRDTGPSLASLNDNGSSFSSIAQVIKKEWKDL